MPMSAQKTAFINACKTAGNAPTDPDAAIGAVFDAIVATVQAATVTVPALGLVAPNGPVTGSSTTGSIS